MLVYFTSLFVFNVTRCIDIVLLLLHMSEFFLLAFYLFQYTFFLYLYKYLRLENCIKLIAFISFGRIRYLEDFKFYI